MLHIQPPLGDDDNFDLPDMKFLYYPVQISFLNCIMKFIPILLAECECVCLFSLCFHDQQF